MGRLMHFREYYLEQRRLQVTNDLSPPRNFLESYQPYLAQVSRAVHFRYTLPMYTSDVHF